MALKIPIPFPIFAPPPRLSPNNPNPTHHHRAPSELRFSRWNNANADKFNDQRRTQKEIEDDIRRERRFDSATRIAQYYDSATPSSNAETFKSTGTPSFPSKRSIPGKKSKYSKNPNPNPDPNYRPDSKHPAFSRFRPNRVSGYRRLIQPPTPETVSRDAHVRVGEDGVSYVIDGAPFEFKYSYTETPKVKPLGLREAAYAPFGPGTMPRPWTGRAPLPPSKKKMKEFDSFQLPQPHKKGVKPVQAPGPFLAGSGPKYVMTREEVLGEALTEEEIAQLIEGCKRSKRQLNMGRDGLTHNMLDNIHAHWKRRRVCKIKCKGVCTVDMENVRQQLEERTGGKIILSKGGVIYLFRGRNYNYRTRPRFPLMLWKPITPVYPRLVQRVPEGLTLEEVTDMRKKGHKLAPICKLGKNGMYGSLVAHVREAFEECELVRINCQGMNGSDYRKIGAKLKDLVPCVLVSFAEEHILIWRGRGWQSSLLKFNTDVKEANESNVENSTSPHSPSQGEEETAPTTAVGYINPEPLNTSTLNNGSEIAGAEESEESLSSEFVEPLSSACISNSVLETENISDSESPQDGAMVLDNYVDPIKQSIKIDPSAIEAGSNGVGSVDEPSKEVQGSNTPLSAIESAEIKLDSVEEELIADKDQQVTSESFQGVSEPASIDASCTKAVLLILQQALESGSAMILEDSDLDPDIVYQKMVDFSKSAPPGPVFRHRLRKVRVKMSEHQEDTEQDIDELDSQTMMSLPTKARGDKKGSKSKTRRKVDFGEHLDGVVPQGSLRVDELAKLLA